MSTNKQQKMNQKLFLPILIFWIFMISLMSCTSKDEKPMVLYIDDISIEKEEFMMRAAFVPHLYKSTDPDRVKKDVLASLIAEKILSTVAQSLKLDTIEAVASHINQLEKEAIFEYWVQENVDKKVEIDQKEIHKAYIRSKQVRVVNYWIESDSLAATQLIYNLENHSNVKQPQEKVIQFGESWGPVEDAVYAMKENQVSSPINVDGQYYIFKLKSVQKSLATASDFELQKAAIEKQLFEWKREDQYQEEALQILQKSGFIIPREQYELILSTLTRQLVISKQEGPAALPLPATIKFSEVQLTLEDQINSPFIHFKDGSSWSVKEFLKKLNHGAYLLNYKNKEIFQQDVPRIIRKMVLVENIAEMGIKAGYKKTSYVKKKKQMWQDYLLAVELQAHCLNSTEITKQDIEEFYNSNQESFYFDQQRKIQEILVSNRELAVKIIKDIQAGKSFDNLAKKHSIRSTASIGGISPFLSLNDWGLVSKKAFNLPINALYGPLETEDNNYSILQVVEIDPGKVKPLSDVQDKIASLLSQNSKTKTINDIIENNISKTDIKINEEVLNSIDVSNMQMLVTKSHFPGRLVVPYPMPVGSSENWFKKLIKK